MPARDTYHDAVVKALIADAHDLHDAVGQYNNYRDILSETDPERRLFLAVTAEIYDRLFAEKYGQFVIKRQKLNLIVFDPHQERIVEWVTQ